MKLLKYSGMTVAGLCLVLFGAISPARADGTSLTFSGKVAGGPVSGTLMFSVSAPNTLTVEITNTEANPTDVGQLISDFVFDVSGMTGPATLMSSTGQEVSIAKTTGMATLGTKGDTMWGVNSSASTIILSALISGPSNLIIGPGGASGVYTNANGSIAGNPAHNPFLTGTVTFELTIPGLSSVSQISNTMVSFGTSPGSNLDVGTSTAPTPEPSSLLLLGTGLFGLGIMLRRRLVTS